MSALSNLDALAATRDGAVIAQLLPYLREEIDRMRATTEARVFEAIRSGSLTPEEARAAWLELFSYTRLLRRFESRVKLGENAAKRFADTLEKGD